MKEGMVLLDWLQDCALWLVCGTWLVLVVGAAVLWLMLLVVLVVGGWQVLVMVHLARGLWQG